MKETTGGRLQPVLMRRPPQLSVKIGRGLVGCWGGVGWRVWGGSPVGGGGSQGGGAYTRPTTTTCIPPGGMCV